MDGIIKRWEFEFLEFQSLSYNSFNAVLQEFSVQGRVLNINFAYKGN